MISYLVQPHPKKPGVWRILSKGGLIAMNPEKALEFPSEEAAREKVAEWIRKDCAARHSKR